MMSIRTAARIALAATSFVAPTQAGAAASHRGDRSDLNGETIYVPDCDQRGVWDCVPHCRCGERDDASRTVFSICERAH